MCSVKVILDSGEITIWAERVLGADVDVAIDIFVVVVIDKVLLSDEAEGGFTWPSREAARAAAAGLMFSDGAWTLKYFKGGSLFSSSVAGTARTES